MGSTTPATRTYRWGPRCRPSHRVPGLVIGSTSPRQPRPLHRLDATARRNRIRFIAYNTRFLILPWVRTENLASHILGRMAARICPVARHQDQRDDNHATTSSGGRENHPSPASLVCRPQLKQPPHTNGTVRCMSNSWVRKCNLVRMSGKTLKEGFIGAGTDGFRLPCEYTFLMVSCEPPLNAIFGTRKPARSQRHSDISPGWERFWSSDSTSRLNARRTEVWSNSTIAAISRQE